MKVIIDIQEDVYKNILQRSTEIQAEGYVLEGAVLNGTPLDDVKAEIDNEWANTHHMYPDYASGLARASEIIDKHIGKAERGE